MLNTFWELLLSSTSQGLLWSLMAIGVYLTFRILDLADM
ncbi:MAG: ABC transporter permease, partial [Lactobacillus sp.]|nr:ABC transporter permease [Lactobacillus sp.]